MRTNPFDILPWDGSFEVSDIEEASLTTVRNDLYDAVENEGNPVFSAITDIVQLILVGVEELAPQPWRVLAKVLGGIVTRNQRYNANTARIRRATVEVLIRLLTPDLDYTMEISDVERVCRQVWGAKGFSIEIPGIIYERVQFSLESGRFWEYCKNKGLARYLRLKHRQVEYSYLLYKNGPCLRRILKPS